MCGIAGALLSDRDAARAAVAAMSVQMVARGPDDAGADVWPAGDGALALAARRLAIIDPSPAGHQPMSDPERGTTIVFNGMIYNFRELRDRLASEGERFASRCDTEVVLRAYGRYGTDCVRHLRGMFAFAVWDAPRQRLFLARDRLGIKPLYYWHDGSRFVFASQVKALLATGLIPPRLSQAGLQTYLSFGAVSEPLTAIEGVLALPAAHTATLADGRLELHRYWELPEPVEAASADDAAGELRVLLEDVVRRHLVSDAPLGVFLSGGIDSSLLAALAARQTSQLRTVSVVFDEPELSEARYIDLVVAGLDSDHERVVLRPSELLLWLDGAFAGMDQPSFDGINTYVVSRAASATGLKVALSGLGGDELFDGYGYVRRVRALERARRLPRAIRAPASRVAGVALRGRSTGEKTAAWLGNGAEPGCSYELLRRLFLEGEVVQLVGGQHENGLPRPERVDPWSDLYGQVSALDLANYTKNVLLRDTDAMSMANSLEVRVPLLDHILVEWALRLPERVKAGRQKALLLEAAGELLPRELHARPKRGFVLPFSRWLREELRDEVDASLRRPPDALGAVLDSSAVAAVWDAYLGGDRRWHRPFALYAACRWAESLESPVLQASRDLVTAR
jgi:asparagine synthase (glutamine-hydrolysing)